MIIGTTLPFVNQVACTVFALTHSGTGEGVDDVEPGGNIRASAVPVKP